VKCDACGAWLDDHRYVYFYRDQPLCYRCWTRHRLYRREVQTGPNLLAGVLVGIIGIFGFLILQALIG
jgi:recombinational DNA repair protein (RecF pathway)